MMSQANIFPIYSIQASKRAAEIRSENVNSELSKPPRKRRRPALACSECRRRKIKCDRNNPCTQCVQSKCSSCIYTSETSLPNRTLVNSRTQPANRLGEARQPTDPLDEHFLTPNSSPRTGCSDLSANLYLEQSSRSEVSSGNDTITEKLLQRIHDLEQKLSDSQKPSRKSKITTEGDVQASLSTPSIHRMREAVSKTRIFGRTHWMGHFEQVRKHLRLMGVV